ncbi:hypothetical protein ACHWQZ_G000935 [Mnemiopsis leidyi]
MSRRRLSVSAPIPPPLTASLLSHGADGEPKNLLTRHRSRSARRHTSGSGSFRGVGPLSRLTVPEHSSGPSIVNRNLDNEILGPSEIVINTGSAGDETVDELRDSRSSLILDIAGLGLLALSTSSLG